MQSFLTWIDNNVDKHLGIRPLEPKALEIESILKTFFLPVYWIKVENS